MVNTLDILQGRRLLLASASPRRRELMGKLGLPFELAPVVEVDESYPADTPAEDVASAIAKKKAEAYKPIIADNDILITADTVVILDDKVLGKPHSREEAVAMLKSLSGKTHTVITGVNILASDAYATFSVATHVKFDKLEENEILYYVDNYRPYDKAGAYGIQEWIGFVGIRGIDGDYYNVMGLPVSMLYRMLKHIFNP